MKRKQQTKSIEIRDEEAEALIYILDCIGGCPSGSRRMYSDSFRHKLRKAYPQNIGCKEVFSKTPGLSFLDFMEEKDSRYV